MLSASRRARCSPSATAAVELDVVGQQTGALVAQAFDFGREGVAAVRDLPPLLFEASHGGALAAVALLDAGQFGAGGSLLFADGGGFRLQLLHFEPLGFEGGFALGPQAFFLFDGSAVALALLGGLFGVAAQAFEFQTGYGETRVSAGKVLAQLAHFVIEGDAVFFAGLLQRPEAFQLGFEANDLLVESVKRGDARIERSLLFGNGHRQLARFALHGQRAGAGLFSAGDGVAVVAEAIGQQEVEVRITHREPLGRAAILGQEAERDSGEQIGSAVAEPVGEAK
jgi:hypothetical protein